MGQVLDQRALPGTVEIVHPLAAGKERIERRGVVARTVVETRPVCFGPVIAVARLKRRRGVAAEAAADGYEALVRHRARGEVDHTAAEFAGIVCRIGLLHQRRCQHVGREDVERDDAAERLGARQRQAVEHRQRIAIAETADVDEAGPLDRQTGHAAKCAGDVALTGARDLLGGEHRKNLSGIARGVAADPAGDHDLAAGNGDFRFVDGFLAGDRRRVLTGLLLVGILIGGFRNLRSYFAGSALSKGGARERQRGREQKQPSQLLASRHV